MTTTIRPPLTALQTAALRQQSANREYRRPKVRVSRVCQACKEPFEAMVFNRAQGPKACSSACRGLLRSGDAQARFWANVDKDGPIPDYAPQLGPCWLWTGGRTKAYGRFVAPKALGGHFRAHVFAYQSTVGPVPSGLCLDHLCRVPLCVRPSHLEPVTVKVNNLRGYGLSGRNARKTHCPKGHPYDAENTRFAKPQPRQPVMRLCRACQSDRHRREWQQEKARRLVEETAKAYRRHLLEDDCRDCDRNDCRTERWLFSEASAADHEHARLLSR